MKPGKELDILITEKVMGWSRYERGVAYFGNFPAYTIDEYGVMLVLKSGAGGNYFSPSINIADAWMVVEKLREMGWMCYVMSYPTGVKNKGCDVFFRSGLIDDDETNWRHNVSFAETAWESFCLTALKVFGYK